FLTLVLTLFSFSIFFSLFLFFFNHTSSPEIYTLSLHDALPILVIAGDSFEMDADGALRLSPLRRGLAIDSTVDIFTFYVPHRHVDRKSGSAGMPRPISYAVFCLKKKNINSALARIFVIISSGRS